MTRATSASSRRSAWAAKRVKSVNATKRETSEKSGIVPPAIWDLTSARCPTVTELEAQAQSPAVPNNLHARAFVNQRSRSRRYDQMRAAIDVPGLCRGFRFEIEQCLPAGRLLPQFEQKGLQIRAERV